MAQNGSIIHIKVVNTDGKLYAVKALSPTGELHDVKGVKMLADEIEAKVAGVSVAAHVKALPQVATRE